MENVFNKESIEKTSINIYIKYHYLDIDELANLLFKFDLFYKRVLAQSFPVYYSEKYQVAFRNFFEIEQINTGNSIRIKLKEGWKPEFKIKDSELRIEIPKLLGIPAIILYALFISGQKILDIQNTRLDNELKKLEIDIKKIELYEKISKQIESRDLLPKKIDDSDFLGRFEKFELSQEADDITGHLKYKEAFHYVEINGIPIKDENKK